MNKLALELGVQAANVMNNVKPLAQKFMSASATPGSVANMPPSPQERVNEAAKKQLAETMKHI